MKQQLKNIRFETWKNIREYIFLKKISNEYNVAEDFIWFEYPKKNLMI